MFKQFTKLGIKPKDGEAAPDSDEEFEKLEQEKQR
jgi:hypothetical protein